MAAGSGVVRGFLGMCWVTLVGVVLQGLWAGEFMSGPDGWVTVHQITAYVLVLLSLGGAVLAGVGLRGSQPRLVWSAVGLFVLMLVQTGLGQVISDAGKWQLVAAHVPVALLVMGLNVYLIVAGQRLRGGGAAQAG